MRETGRGLLLVMRCLCARGEQDEGGEEEGEPEGEGRLECPEAAEEEKKEGKEGERWKT